MALGDISFNTGQQYYLGFAPKRTNYRLAKQYFNKAVSQNPQHAPSLYHLGLMAEKGQEMPADVTQAKDFYSRAAMQGYQPAITRLLELHENEVETADEWNELAEKYYYAANYLLAHACYLHSIDQDSTHSESLFSLGWIHEFGKGPKKNLDLAKKYYFRALTYGHSEAKDRFQPLHSNTASDWYELAEIFFEDETFSDHYFLAYHCYQNAIKKESDHVDSLYSLGWLYHYGHGVKKDLKRAEEYYCKAIALKHSDAEVKLLEIYSDQIKTAQDWVELGNQFYYGEEMPQSFTMTKRCYTRAIDMDQNNAEAQYCLGFLYENGEGVAKNPKTATQYYRVAASLGHQGSKKFLLFQDNAKLTTVPGWYALAMQYFDGSDEVPKDFYLARLCFEEALKHNNKHQASLLKLASLYEHGLGVAIDLSKARQYYEQLFDKKPNLKRIEKKRVQLLVAQNKSIDQKDEHNRTALHRAALDNNLKLFGTLKLLNAKANILDSDQSAPGDYLTDKQRIRVTQLQMLASDSFRKMNLSAPEVVASRIFFQNGNHDEGATLTQLQELYKNEDLKPILDFAKLAMLGKHTLSGRSAVVDDAYDSDEEDQPQEDQRLRINIDPDNKNVNGMVCTADGNKTSVGVFIHKLNNSVFIGGNREKQRVIGTMMHELTHFLAKELHGNSLPYGANEKVNKARFKKICDDLKKLFDEKKKKNPNITPSILELTFTKYSEESYHAELIARIVQTITLSNNGLAELSEPEQELLKYFREVFLEKVKSHVKKLTEKSYSGWSPSIFKPKQQNIYHLDVDDEVDQTPTLGA